jgi:toxin YoeB
MIYTIEILDIAKQHLILLRKNEPKLYKKAQVIISELREHPRSGTGKPEMKKYNLSGYWSRRISDKHRLIYQIKDKEIIVSVISAMGHYGDK